MNSSKGSEAIVVLGDTPYYESLEASMKIRKYVKQRNVSQMPKSAQDIIRGQQEEATKYEAEASKALVKAIENANFTPMVNIWTLRAAMLRPKLTRRWSIWSRMFTASWT